MKKVVELHLGKILNMGKPNETIDADVDIFIEAANESVLNVTQFIQQAAVAYNRVVLASYITDAESIVDLFCGYFDTDSVKTADEDKIEHMKLVAYSADGELTAMGENPNVDEMADHINGTIATLCRQAEKITGKDMSYYAETAEIEPELYRNMHPLTAYQLIRETYLKFAEILIAICKDYEAENEEWL